MAQVWRMHVTFSFMGETFELPYRRSKRIKHARLAVHPVKGPELVLPPLLPLALARSFVRKNSTWLYKHYKKFYNNTGSTVIDGTTIPICGSDFLIHHTGKLRGRTYHENGTLFISGEPSSLGKRVKQFIIDQCHHHVEQKVTDYTKALSTSHRSIQLRDTSSRWGSCTHHGVLSFSWRLALAPMEILDYVIAHEVSHLHEMNHSKDFWKLVAKLDTHYSQHRHWLKQHGHELHQWKFS